VVFLYPTRGTATEGFRDYVGWAPEGSAELLHANASWELQAMAENPPESLANKRLEPDEAEARLFALRLWGRRYFSATLDQFLSFLEHHYQGLCLLPVLADAALVIDEVHALDPHLFRKLVAFVERFDLPLLCMTATLPAGRRGELERRGLEVYPSPSQRSDLDDLRYQEERPRYQLEAVADEHTALARALAAVQAGLRVLWVCNTVRRCQDAALALQAAGAHPIVYHSRFTLRDRQRHHAATIAAFQQRAQTALAVTTQVCEMSLDLDADVLITEHAPPTSLVQRMGRVNRSRSRSPEDRGLILHYAALAPAPYAPEELRAGRALLATLGPTCSQAALAEALEQVCPPEREVDGAAGFLDSGLFAETRGFRADDGFTRQAVTSVDRAEALARVRRNATLVDLLLPAPRSVVVTDPGLPAWCGVAEAPYDPALGLLPVPDGGAA
jgi:CRISPR-associated endonuclease/helicase Cas3